VDHREEALRTLLTDEFLANIRHIPCDRRAADLGRPSVHPKLTMHGLANVVTLIIGLVGPLSWRRAKGSPRWSMQNGNGWPKSTDPEFHDGGGDRT
jgi:hypothetical protein